MDGEITVVTLKSSSYQFWELSSYFHIHTRITYFCLWKLWYHLTKKWSILHNRDVGDGCAFAHQMFGQWVRKILILHTQYLNLISFITHPISNYFHRHCIMFGILSSSQKVTILLYKKAIFELRGIQYLRKQKFNLFWPPTHP